MRRPPRIYRVPELACVKCGEAIKAGRYGGWEHLRRVGITDRTWHVAAA